VTALTISVTTVSRRIIRFALVAVALTILCSSAVTAGAPQPQVRDGEARRVVVRFPQSRSTVSLTGRVRGYDVVDYVLHAEARQHLTARIASTTRPLTMAVYDPDKRAVCVEACGDRWTGPVPRTGDYIVRVGLSRAEARRNRPARYQIRFTLTSD